MFLLVDCISTWLQETVNGRDLTLKFIGLGSLQFSLVWRLNKKFENLCLGLEWGKCSYHSVMDDV